jgi:hypothetical protein
MHNQVNNECQNSKNVWDTLTPYLKLPGSTAKFDYVKA